VSADRRPALMGRNRAQGTCNSGPSQALRSAVHDRSFRRERLWRTPLAEQHKAKPSARGPRRSWACISGAGPWFCRFGRLHGHRRGHRAGRAVSYGFGTRKRSQTRGLLRYLRRHRHTTPSEMVELKFHCCMPIFVARQWIRHRTANVNELSGRYSLMPMLFYNAARRATAGAERSQPPGTAPASLCRPACATRPSKRWQEGRAGRHVDLRVADQPRVGARVGAHRTCRLSTYTQWYLEDRSAQPAALSDLAGGFARAVGNPAVRQPDGGHAQARGTAFLRSVDRLRRLAEPVLAPWSWTPCARCCMPARTASQGRGGALVAKGLGQMGLSNREWTSFLATLCRSQVPDFELDLGQRASCVRLRRSLRRCRAAGRARAWRRVSRSDHESRSLGRAAFRSRGRGHARPGVQPTTWSRGRRLGLALAASQTLHPQARASPAPLCPSGARQRSFGPCTRHSGNPAWCYRRRVPSKAARPG